jgi:adenosylmethionine-8-amino-7-oxononanoate aminotransferase
MCVGKALTGGYMTLGAALCTEKVARGIFDWRGAVVGPRPTFMGNPLACAVASASIDLLLSRDCEADIARLSRGLETGLAPREKNLVSRCPGFGGIGVSPTRPRCGCGAMSLRGRFSKRVATALPDLVYAMPPYVCTDDEIAAITAAMVGSL